MRSPLGLGFYRVTLYIYPSMQYNLGLAAVLPLFMVVGLHRLALSMASDNTARLAVAGVAVAL
jgi:hypothetical protein